MKTQSHIPNQNDVTEKMEILYQEINDIYKTLIPSGPYLGEKDIIVIHNPSNPMSYPVGLPQIYLIGLTRDGLIYDQLTYQYAHELCHVYADQRINNCLIESFCECMSFILLEHMFERWSRKSSIDGAEWYAINFKNYLQNTINGYLIELGKVEKDIMNLDIVDTLTGLSTNTDRKINFLLAYKIYLYYKANPNILHLIPYLHFSAFEKNLSYNGLFSTIEPNLEGIENNVPEGLKVHWDFIKRQVSHVA